MTDNVEKKLHNYWSALRGLRRAGSDQAREDFLKGHFALTICLEKDPRLKARLQQVLTEETVGRQSRPFS